MNRAAILLLLAVLFPSVAYAADLVNGTAFVVDGDTIEINDERIRLWGIDAPEISQSCIEGGTSYPCGLDSSQALGKRIGRKPVSCVRRDTDRPAMRQAKRLSSIGRNKVGVHRPLIPTLID